MRRKKRHDKLYESPVLGEKVLLTDNWSMPQTEEKPIVYRYREIEILTNSGLGHDMMRLAHNVKSVFGGMVTEAIGPSGRDYTVCLDNLNWRRR